VNGQVRQWQLGAACVYTQEEFLRDRHWHIECPDNPGPRQRLFRAVFEQLYAQPPAERRRLMDELTVWAGESPSAPPRYRALTPEEVVRLGEDGLIEIGAHTMTHPVLAALSPSEQRQEIQGSKDRLQDLLGREVTSFAYPHGVVTPDAVATLREAGFTCACGSQAEAVFRGADPFQLPRLCVRNWDGDTFARWLRWWVGR
jgi:peptidoglycan/xylan/chitin deacetylase (PgdA/CDA1 family)